MKLRFLIPVTMSLTLLAACQNPNSTSSSSPSPLSSSSLSPEMNSTEAFHLKLLPVTDNEYTVMKAAGASNAMIFTIDDSSPKGKVACWIDHYVDGKLQGQTLDFASTASDSGGPNKVYFSILGLDDSKQLWTLALRQGDNLSTSKKVVPLSNQMTMITSPLQDVELSEGEAGALGSVVISDANAAVSSSSDIEATIHQNHEVYVLKYRIGEENAST